MTSRRFVGVTTLGALLLAWATMGSVSGTFTATTDNGSNAAATAPAPEPATDFTADVVLNLFPPSCTATLDWVLSVTPGIDGYEIERIRVIDEVVVGGPWTVGPTVDTHVDANIPLQVLGQAYAWRIRATLGPWQSTSATTTDFDLLLCTLL